jgi:hypothetical protein
MMSGLVFDSTVKHSNYKSINVRNCSNAVHGQAMPRSAVIYPQVHLLIMLHCPDCMNCCKIYGTEGSMFYLQQGLDGTPHGIDQSS